MYMPLNDSLIEVLHYWFSIFKIYAVLCRMRQSKHLKQKNVSKNLFSLFTPLTSQSHIFLNVLIFDSNNEMLSNCTIFVCWDVMGEGGDDPSRDFDCNYDQIIPRRKKRNASPLYNQLFFASCANYFRELANNWVRICLIQILTREKLRH